MALQTSTSTAGVRADVLSVRDLRVYYHTPRGAVRAVDGVTFDIKAGERLGLVGESGSGKTTIALALMQLIRPPGKIEGGEVLVDGTDLLKLNDEQMRQRRLAVIAMVAQGAMNSLNPVIRVRDQIVDALRDHGLRLSKGELASRIADLLQRVGLGPHVADMHPHELSGGMKQRVCIAIAISMSPKVIIADEPTSALDVVVQRQVMETLRNVQLDLGAAVILVGHDMGLMAQAVDRLGVMYAGTLAELCEVRAIFEDPLHPYSQLLIASLPSLDKKGVFQGIPGLPPSLLNKPKGCPFRPRCPKAFAKCEDVEPVLTEVRPGRWVSCHLYDSDGVPA
ncbi:MAG TPA: ABC transporter ATP-binding protein [Chloroflexota bacterium]|nr:ABC transporter ATP-binding protein [Chloroflexota bacterium]